MSSMNKLGPMDGKTVRHRFSMPCCGMRTVIYRRLTSLGKKVKTYCFKCDRTVKVWVPKSLDPSPNAS